MENRHYYTDEKNAQIVIALLKAHGIRKVIANPGTTNIAFVGSVQNDPWFEVYSGVDERHSAYMAVGMAHESGEPVVLSCTGATASRNYFPALTEAYYRKLPILALTSMDRFEGIGQLTPQALDRTVSPNDIYLEKYEIRRVKDDRDQESCMIRVNAALLALKRNGGGPVHVNLEAGAMTFNTKALPSVRKIELYEETVDLPSITKFNKIALFVGSGKISKEWGRFAQEHNVAVIASGESDYQGPNRIVASLLCSQKGAGSNPKYALLKPDLIIDIGEVTGDYPTRSFFTCSAPVWRVSCDGKIKDRFRRLEAVFAMSARRFVDAYACAHTDNSINSYYEMWKMADAELRAKLPELPFSNPYIAQSISKRIPKDAIVHYGILNSLRSWNLFPVNLNARTASNVGGFGIDGGVSTLIGAALSDPEKLHFCVVGDLAFFYDMNALGNRHVGKNIRILLVNNGCGAEFNMSFHPGSQFGDQTNDYIAAGGHFASKSRELVKCYVQALGFQYLAADTRDTLKIVIDKFLCADTDSPIVLECFTDAQDESRAHELISNLESYRCVSSVRQVIRDMLPSRVKNAAKELLK